MNDRSIHFVLLILCWTVVFVRISALRSRQQRPVWFTLLLLGTGLLALQEPVKHRIQALAEITGINSLISNLMAVGVATLLLSFGLRLTVTGGTGGLPWRRLRALYCGVTVLAMLTAFSVGAAMGIPSRVRYLPMPGTFTIHTAYWIIYLLYLFVVTGVATVLFWRHMPRIRQGVLRLAVFLLAISTTSFLLFLASRVAALFSTSPSLITIGVYVSSVHTLGITVGCSLAAFLPVIQAAINWWYCNKLYTLWRTLCAALPHIALQPPRTRLVDTLTLDEIELRLHRRLIEIRDGLLTVREWVTPAALDRIRAVIADAQLDGDAAEAATTACWLKIALRSKELGFARPDKSLDLVRRGGVDLGSELRWLCQVAKAWHSPLVNECVARVGTELLDARP